ncbi:hypothetical protein [Pelotalea chapellei]|uniref:DUF2019 domain-containing protein n=1 Tax=Pelotalea chapellei TaxID=44671 RepID=A0ABS5U562_9BACT|nr:hypothetical protein [Pelotalea chapellei]MBT1070806.1 hypothetical protein [Pelotalea chapellei]
MDDKLAVLLKRFAVAAAAHHEALEDMDEDRANTQARMVAALNGALLREGPGGQEGLLALMESAIPVVAGMAAVYLLHLYPDRCLVVLRRIAAEPGLLGFRASVAVERWESGEWTSLT